MKKVYGPEDVFSIGWRQEGHKMIWLQNSAPITGMPLMKCTFPPLFFLHCQPFSCLKSIRWDCVKEDAWKGKNQAETVDE